MARLVATKTADATTTMPSKRTRQAQSTTTVVPRTTRARAAPKADAQMDETVENTGTTMLAQSARKTSRTRQAAQPSSIAHAGDAPTKAKTKTAATRSNSTRATPQQKSPDDQRANSVEYSVAPTRETPIKEAVQTRAKRASSSRSSAGAIKSADQLVAEALEQTDGTNTSLMSINSTGSKPSRVRSSMLALANFQRRARQPSLLAMVRQSTIARDPDTDSTAISQHYTAPTMMHGQSDTSSVAMPTADEETTLNADPFDDFEPDNESTPVNLSKAKQSLAQLDVPASSRGANDGGEDEDELYAYSPQPQRSRKRKSDELEESESIIQVPRSPILGPSPARRQRQESALDFVVPSTAPNENQIASPGAASGSGSDHTPRPQDVGSDTYADPVSSSPPPPLTGQRAVTRPDNRRARPKRAGAMQNRDPGTLSTAALQALLPKRRHRDESRSDYDLASSSSAQMDDDDTTPRPTNRRAKPAASRTTGVRVTAATNTGKTSKTTGRVKTKTQATKRAQSKAIPPSSDKENEPSSPTVPERSSSPLPMLSTYHKRSGPGARSARYTHASTSSPTQSDTVTIDPRRRNGDDDDDDDDGQNDNEAHGAVDRQTQLRKRRQRELEAASAKFKLVDEWDLEFESAPSLGGGGKMSRVDGRYSSGAEWR